jgi:hypothetical protein
MRIAMCREAYSPALSEGDQANLRIHCTTFDDKPLCAVERKDIDNVLRVAIRKLMTLPSIASRQIEFRTLTPSGVCPGSHAGGFASAAGDTDGNRGIQVSSSRLLTGGIEAVRASDGSVRGRP